MINIDKVVSIIRVAQIILGIQDWKIEPHIVPEVELKKILEERPNSSFEIYGAILIRAEFRTADMYLWDSLDTSPNCLGLEHTIFHECLHIVLYPYYKLFWYIVRKYPPTIANTLYWFYENTEEAIINQLASGYVKVLELNRKEEKSTS